MGFFVFLAFHSTTPVPTHSSPPLRVLQRSACPQLCIRSGRAAHTPQAQRSWAGSSHMLSESEAGLWPEARLSECQALWRTPDSKHHPTGPTKQTCHLDDPSSCWAVWYSVAGCKKCVFPSNFLVCWPVKRYSWVPNFFFKTTPSSATLNYVNKGRLGKSL